MQRILSIQSHVVSGYVGNRAATFPLQLLGHEVDVINTVQFSNHTGYNTVQGTRFPDTHMRELFAGLCDNGLQHGYTHLLAGYIGNSGNVRAVEEIARELKRANPALVFVLDPVLGDDGALYVPEELVPLYRDVLCPLADLVTPNQFEAESLTGIAIQSLDDARSACDKLHDLGIPNVVITSFALPEKDSEKLYLVGSELDKSTGKKHCFYIEFPRLHGYFTGSGDLFTALITARYASIAPTAVGGELGGALSRACELATAAQAGVMRETLQFQQQTGVKVTSDNLRRGQRPSDMVRGFELRIIQSQKLITDPVLEFKAVSL
ncbi:putative pyridoxal kinase [Coemansia sp. RSA 1813]|nr:putative pyridoxal kinase [Coemansia sp. RSA 1646]KAJ1767732.1 putative pyridoxal kinase [Coemansia sp. RSA 1843]KAJ2086829.1 putative pyridoxal kinase [Coemansia sp. RSA 986]KAJ2211594.1 putative pyridoxal kinase [Coemansia sp. RSA 487]KAJ2565206.1 putative pyridoxal kinase [Coemansia sp. RSA 1813]